MPYHTWIYCHCPTTCPLCPAVPLDQFQSERKNKWRTLSVRQIPVFRRKDITRTHCCFHTIGSSHLGQWDVALVKFTTHTGLIYMGFRTHSILRLGRRKQTGVDHQQAMPPTPLHSDMKGLPLRDCEEMKGEAQRLRRNIRADSN